MAITDQEILSNSSNTSVKKRPFENDSDELIDNDS